MKPRRMMMTMRRMEVRKMGMGIDSPYDRRR
jgi:hypothetical protein